MKFLVKKEELKKFLESKSMISSGLPDEIILEGEPICICHCHETREDDHNKTHEKWCHAKVWQEICLSKQKPQKKIKEIDKGKRTSDEQIHLLTNKLNEHTRAINRLND